MAARSASCRVPPRGGLRSRHADLGAEYVAGVVAMAPDPARTLGWQYLRNVVLDVLDLGPWIAEIRSPGTRAKRHRCDRDKTWSGFVSGAECEAVWTQHLLDGRMADSWFAPMRSLQSAPRRSGSGR